MAEASIVSIYHLLREIRKVASEASMTGSLRKSSPLLARTFNRCLEAVREKVDEWTGELFQPLDPESVHVDEVGAAATLLAATLKRHVADEEEQGLLYKARIDQVQVIDRVDLGELGD